MGEFSLKRDERLGSRKAIENLFLNGRNFVAYPFRVVYDSVKLETPYPAQIAISVPKKRFKLAVTRNLIKRKIREAYRLNKHILYPKLKEQDVQMAFMLVYIADKVLPHEELEHKIIITLNRLAEVNEKAD